MKIIQHNEININFFQNIMCLFNYGIKKRKDHKQYIIKSNGYNKDGCNNLGHKCNSLSSVLKILK